MITLLRRARWNAALLLAFSPALGGAVLPLLHPCEGEASSLQSVAAASDASDAAHAHHGTAPSHSHDDDAPCTCVGPCHTAVALELAPPSVGSAPAVTRLPTLVGWPRVEAATAYLPADLLPPKTAPPIA